MWLEKYQKLSSIDRDKFGELANELLNKNFILAYHYDNKNRVRRPNSNYNFIVRNFEIFENYFKMTHYKLERDDNYHVISLSNELGYNHQKMDKYTTLFLLTLRLMYDEAKEQAATSEVVYTTTSQIIYKMIDLKLIDKKPTIKSTVDVLRFMVSHNIITKIDKSLDDFSANLVILPTILFVISNEKINAIFQIMFKHDENGNDIEA